MMAEEERNREREKDTKNESTAGCSVLALARRSCVYACAHAPLDAPMIHRPLQESTLFYCSNPLSLHQPLQQSASRVCRCFCRLYTNLLLFLSAISTSTRYQKGPGITRNLSFSPRHRSIGCLFHSPKNHSCSSHELN